jgi:hypothetical protein
LPSSSSVKNPVVARTLESPINRQIFALFAEKIEGKGDVDAKGVFEFDESAMDAAYGGRLEPAKGLAILTNFSYLLDDSIEPLAINLDKSIDKYIETADRKLLTEIEGDIENFRINLGKSLQRVINTLVEGVENKLQDISSRFRFYVNEVGQELYDELTDSGLMEEA